MSFESMAMVVTVKNIPPTEKLILLLLANYADEKGASYPSYKTIAELANCSRRKAIGAVKTLEEMGLLTLKRRKKSNKDNHSNVFIVNDPSKLKHPSAYSAPASEQPAPPSANNDVLPSEDSAPASADPAPNTITIYNHKDTITNTKKKSKRELIDEFLPSEASSNTLRIKHPKISQRQAVEMVESFKDAMRNRKAAWKDLQGCFRIYVKEEYITPMTVSTISETSSLSHNDIGILLDQEEQRIANGGINTAIQSLTSKVGV
jgi:hypothetical protein